MHGIGPVMLSLAAVGFATALSVALYAALPHSFLKYAERHGRFHGLGQDEPIRSGTPADDRAASDDRAVSEGIPSGEGTPSGEVLPEAALIGQTA